MSWSLMSGSRSNTYSLILAQSQIENISIKYESILFLYLSFGNPLNTMIQLAKLWNWNEDLASRDAIFGILKQDSYVNFYLRNTLMACVMVSLIICIAIAVIGWGVWTYINT